MNSDTLRGQLRTLVGRTKEAWGRMTHDEPTRAAGHMERLIGEAQFYYGVARAAARHRDRELALR